MTEQTAARGKARDVIEDTIALVFGPSPLDEGRRKLVIDTTNAVLSTLDAVGLVIVDRNLIDTLRAWRETPICGEGGAYFRLIDAVDLLTTRKEGE